MNESKTVVIVYHVFILTAFDIILIYVTINNLYTLLTGVSLKDLQLKIAKGGNQSSPQNNIKNMSIDVGIVRFRFNTFEQLRALSLSYFH